MAQQPLSRTSPVSELDTENFEPITTNQKSGCVKDIVAEEQTPQGNETQRKEGKVHSWRQMADRQVKRVLHVFDCPGCEFLWKALAAKDEEILRLKAELHEEMRIHEGYADSHSYLSDMEKKYRDFFLSEMREAVSSATFESNEDRTAHRVMLCKIFQAAYDYTTEMLLATFNVRMRDLFSEEGRRWSDKNVEHAHTRLLIASGAATTDKNLPAGWERCGEESDKPFYADHINRKKKWEPPPKISPATLEILKTLEHGTVIEHSRIPIDQLKEFIEKAVRLSWDLVTSVPPMVVTCSPKVYQDRLHEIKHGGEHISEDHVLQYTRPILLANYQGEVSMQGNVRILPGDSDTRMSPEEFGQCYSTEFTFENIMAEFQVTVPHARISDWFSLGMELKLEEAELRKIHPEATWDPERCIPAMIELWLQSKKNASWEILAAALEKRGETEIALRIGRKCIKHPHKTPGDCDGQGIQH